MHSSRMHTICCSGHQEGGCLTGGVCPGGCLPGMGVSVQERLPRGVSASGVSARGVSARGVCPGGCLAEGCLPQCMLGYTPPETHTPLVNRITDACENITFPQLRCGR